jgi:energy-coupling factor transport system ATP-binding protein
MSAIELRNLTHVYCPGTPYEKKALDDISVTINPGEFIGIIGPNGSGKSTLIQHLNGSLSPTAGNVFIFGKDVADKAFKDEVWKCVSVVFQFPERQLFEDTVFDEIAYGLKNLEINKGLIEYRVKDALNRVGLNFDEIAFQPPLALSGGTRRKIALACAFAIEPKILALDEPTAGLDSSGTKRVLCSIKNMQKEKGTTIVMVSHSLNELLLLADNLAFIDKGRLIAFGDKREVVKAIYENTESQIVLPDYIKLLFELKKQKLDVNIDIINYAEAEMEIDNLLREINK